MADSGRGLITTFARHPVAGNLLMLLLIVFGLFGLTQLNRQVLPDFQIDVISVGVQWPGASPEDIETNVIDAIESEVRFIDSVDRVESIALESQARITIVFELGSDMGKALTDVQSAVARITTFPEDIERPVVDQVLEADEVCRVEISGPFPEQALKLYARQIRDDLLARGLTRIEIQGQRDSEIWVEVPESALRSLDLTLNDVSTRIAQASQDLPSGSIESGGVSRQIRSEGLARSPSEIGNIEILSRESGEKVLLKDVASISESFEQNAISRYHDGITSIGLMVTRSKGVDSMTAQQTVEAYVAEMQDTLPPSLKVEMYDVFAATVEQRISMLLSNGAGGLLLVLTVLYVFLNGRVAFWVAFGIPIAILASLGAMAMAGITLNMISLFAIIMGLGIIVDDAIVVGERTETLHRRGMSPVDATIEGAQSMFAPVMAASLTTIAAFFPLLLVGAVIGQIIGDLPKTIIFVIIASLVECFLVLPMHLRGALVRLEKGGKREPGKFHLAFNRFRDGQFTTFISAAMERRYTAVIGTFCALLLSIAVLASGRIGFEFFPSPETDVVFANFAFAPGTPRARSLEMMRELERAARKVEEDLAGGYGELIIFSVGSVSTTEGREGSPKLSGDHLGALFLEFIPSDQRNVRNTQFIKAWRDEVTSVPGVERLLMFERSAGGPPGRDLDIRVLGADLDTLKAAAMELRAEMGTLPGVMSADDDLPYGKQEIVMEVTPSGKAMGFSTQEVARQVRNSFEGAIARRFARQQEEVIVRVKLPESSNAQATIRDLYLRTPNGSEVPLTEVVDISTRVGFSQIGREDGMRQISVTADVDSNISTTGEVLGAIERDLAPSVKTKYGVQLLYKGRADEQSEAVEDVGIAALAALATMYIILAWVFSSYTIPFLVLSIVPLGLV
ncbi:MAG: efflux RND transporter permease subunit, partial [Gammaproteobacteria bacterium]